MKVVTYHDPESKTDKPAFIIAQHRANRKEGRKERTADLLVLSVSGNRIVKYVAEGKEAMHFSL